MRNLSLLFFSTTLILSSLTGCGGSVETCGDSGCSTGTGGSTSGSTSSTSSTSSNGTGGVSSTSSTSVGGGTACGGFVGAQCAPSEYCDYSPNSCGGADDMGACKPRPTNFCPDLYAPTCACDGKVYNSPCEAFGAGFDENDNGNCTAPMGKFACGSFFCEVGVTYCRHSISDVGGEPSTYECVSLPPVCGNPATCACLDKEPCGSSCIAKGGGFVVSCPGG